MAPLPASERKLRAQIAAGERWARTTDRAAATAAARDAQKRRYLERAAELHPGGSREVIERAAHDLWLADQRRRALASARARRLKAVGRRAKQGRQSPDEGAGDAA